MVVTLGVTGGVLAHVITIVMLRIKGRLPNPVINVAITVVMLGVAGGVLDHEPSNHVITYDWMPQWS